MNTETGVESPRIRAVPKQSRPAMLLKNFRVPAQLWAKVEARAAREDVNPSDVVREAIEAHVDKEGEGS